MTIEQIESVQSNLINAAMFMGGVENFDPYLPLMDDILIALKETGLAMNESLWVLVNAAGMLCARIKVEMKEPATHKE